jgi:hypothetical protein
MRTVSLPVINDGRDDNINVTATAELALLHARLRDLQLTVSQMHREILHREEEHNKLSLILSRRYDPAVDKRNRLSMHVKLTVVQLPLSPCRRAQNDHPVQHSPLALDLFFARRALVPTPRARARPRWLAGSIQVAPQHVARRLSRRSSPVRRAEQLSILHGIVVSVASPRLEAQLGILPVHVLFALFGSNRRVSSVVRLVSRARLPSNQTNTELVIVLYILVLLESFSACAGPITFPYFSICAI